MRDNLEASMKIISDIGIQIPQVYLPKAGTDLKNGLSLPVTNSPPSQSIGMKWKRSSAMRRPL